MRACSKSVSHGASAGVVAKDVGGHNPHGCENGQLIRVPISVGAAKSDLCERYHGGYC